MCQVTAALAGTGREDIYGPGGLPIGVLQAVLVLASLALVATVWAIREHRRDPASALWQRAFLGAWIFWVFAPPLWFSFEYFQLYKPCGQPGTFEAFKYGQELAHRLWVGIATVMTLLYAKRG